MRFLTPTNEQEISQLPFTAQIDTGGLAVSSVELILEGEYIGVKTAQPYSFQIETAKKGWQTLTAVVRLSNGDSVQNSIRVNIAE